MTEDELDLLASAYLDGEATQEEVALVERDPDLLARVETMRAVSGEVGAVQGPAPAVKEQHLAAALAAFEAGAGAAEPSVIEPGAAADDNVLDFRAGAQGQKSARTRNGARSAGVGGLPSWLPAAAVFVLIAGGVIALVSTQSDDFDAAIDTASEESADDSTEAGSSEDADAAGEAQTEVASDSAALATEAERDDTAGDEEAMEDEEEAMEEAAEAEAAAPADSDAGDGAATTTTAQDRFITQEPVLVIPGGPLPDLDQLIADLPERFDPVESNCADRIELDPGLEPVGYVPVVISGLPAELFAIVDGTGAETGLLFEAETCTPIE